MKLKILIFMFGLFVLTGCKLVIVGDSNRVFTVGEVIDNIEFKVTDKEAMNLNWTVTECSISPVLPIGLSLESNCTISGTPVVSSELITYTLQASNADGYNLKPATVKITVVSALQVPNISDIVDVVTATTGTAITDIEFENAGGAIKSCAITPMLSAGLDFNTTTCKISGTPSVAQDETIYTVTARNLAGYDPTPATVKITIVDVLNSITNNDEFNVFFINKPLNNLKYELQLGTNRKDVYLLFTNPELEKATIAPSVIRENIPNPSIFEASIQNSLVVKDSNIMHNIIPQKVRDFNENPPTLIKKKSSTYISAVSIAPVQSDVEGATQTFNDAYGNQVDATCKKIVTANDTTLNIWVANDSFGEDCEKIECVTQSMIDIIADKFLKEGSNNDIYEYVTNVIGEEWGETSYSSLIDNNDEITILFFDIANDNQNSGGTAGYFYSRDNFKKTSYDTSNERIMFYMDSVMYASKEGDIWDINDFWPNFLISTLAHEFQHMIHFYQKIIKAGASSNSWFNEMCSMSIEDIVADKINAKGPRGVDPLDGTAGSDNNFEGRLPLFNLNNDVSLVAWHNSFPEGLVDYSASYSFGAFLIRNYGGTALLQNMVQNDKNDTEAIITALNSLNITNKTFSDLLREWGSAVLLSDNDTDDSATLTYEYNIDNYFFSTMNGLEYRVGSINMYNYGTPKLYTNTDDLTGDFGKYETSNIYYHVGSGLTGDVKLSIGMDSKTQMTVIVK
jgi:hypothetical protein